jgi:hypothetical protein
MTEKIDISVSKNKKLIVDIDGVLAIEQVNQPYSLLQPVKQATESLKILRKSGYVIILHTSRFEFERAETIAWLKTNGFEYDKIEFGKQRGILYIDDRGYRFSDWETFFEDIKIN